LPLTGGRQKRGASVGGKGPRIFSETAAETVEQSTMIWGDAVGGEKPVLAGG